MLLTAIYGLITAFVLTYLSIPPLIFAAKKFNFYDLPNSRKSHTEKIPRLGGIGIFVGWFATTMFWCDFAQFPALKYLLSGVFVLAFVGIKDDISGLNWRNKFLGQTVAALILVIGGDIRITSFYGILGFGVMPYEISVVFTTLTILTIINAYNLIDGVNGLASSIAIIASVFYSLWFSQVDGSYQYVIITMSLIGSLIAFLRFNITPAKIFMGDTGSMVLGYLLAFMSILFLQLNGTYSGEFSFNSSPAMAIIVLILPLYDLLRSFFFRLIRKKNPFKPDKNHLHHLLLNLGFSHEIVTLILATYSISSIFIAYMLRSLNNQLVGFIVLGYTIILNIILVIFVKKKNHKPTE
jgi:UDP-N-acetylmuramyl pentapeptide phosphotransferase/UDP-N-acetylglucosamine-1-phosphate transferase